MTIKKADHCDEDTQRKGVMSGGLVGLIEAVRLGKLVLMMDKLGLLLGRQDGILVFIFGLKFSWVSKFGVYRRVVVGFTATINGAQDVCRWLKW